MASLVAIAQPLSTRGHNARLEAPAKQLTPNGVKSECSSANTTSTAGFSPVAGSESEEEDVRCVSTDEDGFSSAEEESETVVHYVDEPAPAEAPCNAFASSSSQQLQAPLPPRPPETPLKATEENNSNAAAAVPERKLSARSMRHLSIEISNPAHQPPPPAPEAGATAAAAAAARQLGHSHQNNRRAAALNNPNAANRANVRRSRAASAGAGVAGGAAAAAAAGGPSCGCWSRARRRFDGCLHVLTGHVRFSRLVASVDDRPLPLAPQRQEQPPSPRAASADCGPAA